MCAALSLVASVPRIVEAQRVLGIGDDATVLPRGGARISVFGAWTTYNELYGPGGKLEQLGAPLSSDSLGATQLEFLRPIETAVRSLTAQSDARVTLGPARTDWAGRVARSMVALDLGLTSRIMLIGRLPYEHTMSEVVMDVNPRGVSDHPANIGLNPSLVTGSAAPAQNRRVVDSLVRAAEELTTRLSACGANPADPVCGNRPQVEALVSSAQAFANEIATTYGIAAVNAPGRLFVPLVGGTLQTAVEGRVTAFNTAFKAYIPQLSPWEKPFPAPAPISAVQANTLISDALDVAPIGFVDRSHLGDIELGAKVLLFDTFGSAAEARAAGKKSGFRLAIGGLARIGTGQVDRPNELVDIGTGDGQTDVEANGAADIVVTRRFWASVIGRFGVQLKDELPLRIPDVSRNPFQAAYREQTVSRDLGDYLEIVATPRYVYNDYLSLSAQWYYRRKGEDKYTGTFSVESPVSGPLVLDAAILGVGTEQSEQRIGGGATFSTLRAFDRGRTGVPLDIQIFHYQSMSGSGYVPKRFSTQIQLRYYTRLFGAPLRPRPVAAPAGD